ncbi:MAG: hypothetical protein AB7G75_02580 [Candidatus Binatia bacterium]
MTPRNRVLSGILAVVGGLLIGDMGFAMPSRPLMVETYHGVPYVSGGVSENDRQALRQITTDDNLQLIFAAKDRDYLSDVAVHIRDERGHEVLNTVAQGPWLFTKLPSGKYRITASTMGHSQGAVVELSPKNKTRVYLTWENALLKFPSPAVVQK